LVQPRAVGIGAQGDRLFKIPKGYKVMRHLQADAAGARVGGDEAADGGRGVAIGDGGDP